MYQSIACVFILFTCWPATGSAQTTIDNVTETTTISSDINATEITTTTTPVDVNSTASQISSSTVPGGNLESNSTTNVTDINSTTSGPTDGIESTTENAITTIGPTTLTGISSTESSAGTESLAENSTPRPPPTTNPKNATTATRNCPSLTPADVKISEIQGKWYIQAYTGPSDGGQNTQCDEFDITIDEPRNKGSIVYNFIRKGFKQPSVEVAEITLLPQPGQFFYNVSGVDLSMTTTILVFRQNEAYVHLACPKDVSKHPTLVIATKRRTEPNSVVTNLVTEAAKHGATIDVRMVDNAGVTCPSK